MKSLVAPLYLKHHAKMDFEDKLIWDAAYDEEYDGFESRLTWVFFTDDQCFHLSKGK